jgi:PTH2 family peptidyl-tRNA hydrolase
MSNYREDVQQVIVIRKDLDMPPGKLASQVAHASMAALFECGEKDKDSFSISYISQDDPIHHWINYRFKKIVLYVKSLEKLLKIKKIADLNGKPNALINDAGLTVFNGGPTVTCLGIGPMFKEDFKGITDKLQLLS